MAAMRRVLTYGMVWGGATTLAMLLVWFAARPVVRGAVFGEPPARPVVIAPSSAPPQPSTPPPADSSTVATASPSPSPSAAPATHDRTYVTGGGRVVLSLTQTAARLVSATPNPGYEVRIWREDEWLRVDFRRGKSVSSLFATWNGHPPTVQVVPIGE
jgi:hypothetical protein